MAKKVDHELRKREIAEKAIRLFSQVGYDNVSLIMIAAATGISRTVLYRYFCSKREVLDAAILTVTETIETRCSAIMAERCPNLPKLERVCQTVVEVMFDHKAFLVAVFDFVVGMARTGIDMTAAISHFTAGSRGAIRALITHAIERGECADALSVDRISDALYAQFESAAMRIVIGTEQDATAAKERFADTIRTLAVRA